MSQIKAKGSTIELQLFSLLEESKIKYEKHPRLFGKPDAFIEPNILIFADGDFWHGWHFHKWRGNLSTHYWLPKIERNIKRDKQVTRRLRKEGFVVVRIWEHTMKSNPNKALEKIINSINKL